ncbi:MAG TPA: cytochrome P450 [Opitutaceae bacterium]|nr:cytochrome P450 [Opitutaceae bacterium]
MTTTEERPSPIPQHLGPGESGGESASPQLLRDAVSYLVEGYRAHGPVFLTKYRGAECVVIAGQEANEFFWQNPENWSFADARKGFTNQLGPSHVTRLEGTAHSRKRRLLKPGFAMDSVARHVPAMAVETKTFLGSRAGGADLMELLMELLLTLNSRTLLKVELTAQERTEAIRFEEDLMFGINNSVDPAAHYSGVRYGSDRENVFSLLDRQVEDRIKGERRDDNLQALIDQDAGSFGALTAEELRYDCYLLLIAGIENTSRLIARCVERLAANPAWAEEIRGELAGYAPSSFARGVGSFPKLRSFIQETERLHPGLIFMSRRTARDLEFKGFILPKGRTILQVHTLPHFLAENYPEPLRFDPGRWLEGEPPRRTHLTFGGGTHICLGMNISRLQTPVVLAELLTGHDVALGYEPPFTYSLDPGMERRRAHFPVRISARSASA